MICWLMELNRSGCVLKYEQQASPGSTVKSAEMSRTEVTRNRRYVEQCDVVSNRSTITTKDAVCYKNHDFRYLRQ